MTDRKYLARPRQAERPQHIHTHDTGFKVFTNIHEPGKRYIFITFFCLSIFHAKFNTTQVLREVKGSQGASNKV